MRNRFALTQLLLCLVCGAAAAANDDALRRCRGLSDAAARLACYDALPVAAPPAAAVPVLPQTAVVQGTATERAAPSAISSAIPSATSSATPSATSIAAPSATPAKAVEDSFGFEQRTATQDIRSSIVGVVEGWDRNTRFRLANGQVWQVADDSSAAYYLRDPKVIIKRALLSGFEMEIEGARRAPRVRRVE